MATPPRVTNQIQFPTYSVTAPGTAQQFPDSKIPDGFKTVFKNRLSAAGNFYLGDTKANAEDATARKVIEPGESITVEIDNLNRLWRDADSATDRLEVTLLAPS